MNCIETPIGLLFTENELPNWIGYSALLFLVFIFFAVKYLIDNFQDFVE